MATTPWDFWTTMDQLFTGEGGYGFAADTYAKFKEALQGNTRFKQPKFSQDAMDMANLLNTLGETQSSQDLMWNVLSQGFKRPTWNTSFLNPLYQQWGMNPYNSSTQNTLASYLH